MEEIIIFEWVKKLMAKYYAAELIQRVEYKYDKIEDIDQVGITYANIYLDEMFWIKNTVVTSHHYFIKAFSKDYLMKYQGENVYIATTNNNEMFKNLPDK